MIDKAIVGPVGRNLSAIIYLAFLATSACSWLLHGYSLYHHLIEDGIVQSLAALTPDSFSSVHNFEHTRSQYTPCIVLRFRIEVIKYFGASARMVH